MTKKFIGGKFGLPTCFSDSPCSPDFLSRDPILFFNARSGIKLIVDQFKPRRVWLPSYLCPTMLTAIDPNISSVIFYPVGEHLSVTSDEFLFEIQTDDLFICIDYFGFPFDELLLEQVKQRGCKILRDCSQALFFDLHNDNVCDFHLFSPRKFLGVPDGGILHAKNYFKLRIDKMTPPDEEIYTLLLQAVILRREFDLYGVNREWYGYFKQGEFLFEPGDSSMSELSQVLLRFGFNYETIRDQRRKNYLALAKRLSKFALFPFLPDEVVPLGFPIVLSDRDLVRDRLFGIEIYPPIHWIINDSVPKIYTASHQLAEHILTLPCDQRYSLDDMFFLADKLLEVIQ